MTTLGAIHHGDIDRITDAAMNDAINVCNTGEGYCRRCHADRGLGVQGTCRYQNAQIDVMNAYGMNGLTPVTIEALEYRIVVADSLLTAARQALIAAQQQMGASR
jgi:hypothetical protein